MRVLTAAVLLLVLSVASSAGEKVTPVLAADPAVMKIVNSLEAGHGAKLPRFKVAGDINAEAKRWGLDKRGPGCRDYCLKMAWMPERKRAIFYGANHGVPHRLNDVWEHDLPSNTWYCLYGPDQSKGRKADWKDVDPDSEETKAGIIRTKRGGPAIVPHSWWNLTYDHRLKAMLTPCSWSMSNKTYFKLLKKGKHKPPLWAFYPEKKKWEPILGARGDLPRYENARQMEYVPELGGTVWTKSAGMYLYDSKANTWKQLGKKSKYGKDLPPRTSVTVYLPDRKMLVAHARAGKGKPSQGYPESMTYHYSTEKNEWKKVAHSKERNNPPPGFDAQTNFAYDSVAKVCLLWDPVYSKALWAYDPEKIKWTKLAIKGAQPPTKGKDVKLAYYDTARNVFVVNGLWVYRHKRRAKDEKAGK
jgi:hypothetical protein